VKRRAVGWLLLAAALSGTAATPGRSEQMQATTTPGAEIEAVPVAGELPAAPEGETLPGVEPESTTDGGVAAGPGPDAARDSPESVPDAGLERGAQAQGPAPDAGTAAEPGTTAAPAADVMPAGAEPAAEDLPLVPELSIESMEAAPTDAAEQRLEQGLEATVPNAAAPVPYEEAPAEAAPPPEVPPLEILGKTVQPGERRRLRWAAGQSFSGQSLDTPVIVVRGVARGPALCLTAAVHGDELNGVEIVRLVMHDIDPGKLSGTVIGVPIVNLLGFTRGSRYLPDRRDLNRYFPGNPHGSSASRIAQLFFNQVVRHCDRLVDFHTGSFKRTNLPQLRADLQNPEVLEFVGHFGATAVLHAARGAGTLRYAASSAGIAAVTFELGEPSTLQHEHVEFGVKAIETLLDKLGMVKRFRLWSEPQPLYYGSRWVRADRGGILITSVQLGARVKVGDALGSIANPLSNERSEIITPHDGTVLGMALSQFVLPGFAAFHIGIESKPTEAALQSEAPLVGGLDEIPDDMDADESDVTGANAVPVEEDVH
jgi:predicted deacylase